MDEGPGGAARRVLWLEAALKSGLGLAEALDLAERVERFVTRGPEAAQASGDRGGMEIRAVMMDPEQQFPGKIIRLAEEATSAGAANAAPAAALTERLIQVHEVWWTPDRRADLERRWLSGMPPAEIALVMNATSAGAVAVQARKQGLPGRRVLKERALKDRGKTLGVPGTVPIAGKAPVDAVVGDVEPRTCNKCGEWFTPKGDERVCRGCSDRPPPAGAAKKVARPRARSST